MIFCPSEEFIPIPTSTSKSYYDVKIKAAAACKAAELLLVEGHKNVEITEENVDDAIDVAKNIIAGKNISEMQEAQLNNAISTPAGAILVQSILKQYNHEILHEGVKLRNYITNRLIVESDSPDPKIRLDALKTLGKIGGIDLFVERKEFVIQNRSTVDLENTVREKMKKLMGITDAENAVIRQEIVIKRPEVTVENELGGLSTMFEGK